MVEVINLDKNLDRRKRWIKPKDCFCPIGDYVVCHVPPPPSETEGGIVLPDGQADSSKFYTPVGEVIAIGPKVVQVKPGDMVLVHADTNCGKARYDNSDYYLIKEERLAGILKEPWAGAEKGEFMREEREVKEILRARDE